MAPARRSVAWRGSISCALLCLLLAVASTLEVYEELPHVDSDSNNVYQDINYFGTGPEFPAQSSSPPAGLLLSELLNAWRQKMDYRQNTLYRIPKLAKEDDRNPGIQKFGIVKRLVDVFRGSRMQYRLSSLIPQQKWKIKKGKVIGSQMICYFKLCAFRSPS